MKQIIYMILGLVLGFTGMIYGLFFVLSGIFDPTLAWILMLVVLIMIASDSYIIIPTGEVGALKLFTKRLKWKPMKEGFHFKPPFLCRVALIKLKLQKAEAKFSFLTQNEDRKGKKSEDGKEVKKGPGLEVFTEGELNFVADPSVFEEKEEDGEFGQPLIVRTGEDLETLISGIVNSTKAEIGKLGGDYAGTDFIDNRRVLADIINCFLRLSKPPHIKHETEGDDGCGIVGCGGKLEKDGDIFKFYEKHADFVLRILKHEKDRKEDHSPIELRYGVDIITYNLTKVDFTEDVKKAFEEEQETKALEGVFDDRLKAMGKALKAMGPTGTAQLAVNFVETTYNEEVSHREVISVEGNPSAVLVPSSFGASGKKGGS